jgi:superfamily I DNA and/or RNA helicase
MGEKIEINSRFNIVLIYINDKGRWEDKTSSINALFSAYYYGKFTGYDVYFKGAKKKFFYPFEKFKILNYIKDIHLDKTYIFVDNIFVEPIKIQLFDSRYYKVYTKDKSFVTNKISLKDSSNKNTFQYFRDLSKFAGHISEEDEPLYLLSKNYEKLETSKESVIFHYLEGYFEHRDVNVDDIYVPFSFNQSQFTAIKNTLNNSISVIEGPPGTGKTQTILNLISNILIQGKNCAVVSNNNTAIENVYEKLTEEKLQFVAASLGRSNNVEKFFNEIDETEIKLFLDNYNEDHNNKEKTIQELSVLMNKLQEIELNKAQLQNELHEIEIEFQHFRNKNYHTIQINDKLISDAYLKLLHQLEVPKKIGFLKRISIRYKYKITINKLDLNRVFNTLEKLFYEKRINEIKDRIYKYDDFLQTHDLKQNTEDIKRVSKKKLLKTLYEKYKDLAKLDFTKKDYKFNYLEFLKRFPVILSTSQSLLNNAPSNFIFDYLIIDEASQGDLLSSVLAMSKAKNLVVVGDSRQLQQIDEERLFDISKSLSDKYHIKSSYQYQSNSILKSVKESIIGVPTVLLKEHYRCAPDIINFCNKMFYNDELIPMTVNNGNHIEIIKTVPGNHARKNPNGTGLYNQREIDEIEHLVNQNIDKKVGVITPFRYQAKLIQAKLKNLLIESDTIHKFQGRQKDEVILSFVVNNLEKDESIIDNRLYDFIMDEKLLNVAISRGVNKVTAIVSDGIYNSKNNIINDFIKYSEHLYGNSITKSSTITSVFDYLYSQNKKQLLFKLKNKGSGHETELLMIQVIDEVLKNNTRIDYTMHIRLSNLIDDVSFLSEEEIKFVLHPWAHVDFLFYNRVSKERLFVLEVDGIRFHEQKIKQNTNDGIKDKALEKNGIKVYRFKTNESNEFSRLKNIISQYS